MGKLSKGSRQEALLKKKALPWSPPLVTFPRRLRRGKLSKGSPQEAPLKENTPSVVTSPWSPFPGGNVEGVEGDDSAKRSSQELVLKEKAPPEGKVAQKKLPGALWKENASQEQK